MEPSKWYTCINCGHRIVWCALRTPHVPAVSWMKSDNFRGWVHIGSDGGWRCTEHPEDGHASNGAHPHEHAACRKPRDDWRTYCDGPDGHEGHCLARFAPRPISEHYTPDPDPYTFFNDMFTKPTIEVMYKGWTNMPPEWGLSGD